MEINSKNNSATRMGKMRSACRTLVD